MSTFAEIQVGDTVRSTRNGVTREGVVEAIGPKSAHTTWPVVEIANIEDDSIEIVDRPTPAVSLPSTPTLGWATHANDGQLLGLFSQKPNTRQIVVGVTCDWGRFSWEPSYVTAFTEAVAVPKSALDELRRAYIAVNTNVQRGDAIYSFFAAIDNASTR